jgi:hypothetical protein
METTCINCDGPVALQYCPSCGQKKYRRIDKKYLVEEIQYTLLHVNKGFLYSVKSLLRNPGKTAREYIKGLRVNHYKPILLAAITTVTYAFISKKLINYSTIYEKSVSYDMQRIPLYSKEYEYFLLRYWNYITLALIPLFAILTRFFFRKREENYFEHIVMNAYLQSLFSMLFIIILVPVAFFFQSAPSLFINWNITKLLLYPFVLVWFFKTYYPDLKLSVIIGKVLMMFLLVMLVVLAVSVAYAVYLYQTRRV